MMQGQLPIIDPSSAPIWDTAVPDWETRIKAGQSILPDLPLNRAMAEKGLRIFKRLRVPDMQGMPRLEEVCGPWYFGIVEALFGAYDPVAMRRMISELFLLIPKKNSKSSYGGPLMLTALIMNERPSGEFNLIAPTIEIAKIAFRQAVGTIKADPALAELFHIRDHMRIIVNRNTEAYLQIKAADTDIVTGGKSIGTMIDETHVFASKPKAEDLYVEIRGALAARPDGFLIQTTTQSKDPPLGVFKRELDYVRAIRDGRLKGPILPILYEYPEDMIESDAWHDPKTWSMVNPNLGRSVDEAYLLREFEKAKEAGRPELALFASQHFNIEIGSRLRSDHWAGGRYWDDATSGPITLELIKECCDVAVVGVDGGGADDLYAMAVMGRHRDTRQWLVWVHAWCWPEVLELRKEIAPTLRAFEAQGDLTIISNPTEDIESISAIVFDLHQAGLLPQAGGVGLDPYGVAQLIDAMEDAGVPAETIAAVPQGYKLNAAIVGAERKLADGTLRHGGQAILTWAIGNAKIEQRGNAVIITKQAAGKAKIDPLMAMLNAVALMSRNPVSSAQLASPWDDPSFNLVAQ